MILKGLGTIDTGQKSLFLKVNTHWILMQVLDLAVALAFENKQKLMAEKRQMKG